VEQSSRLSEEKKTCDSSGLNCLSQTDLEKLSPIVGTVVYKFDLPFNKNMMINKILITLNQIELK